MSDNDFHGTHMSHCNQGEYIGGCKYGEATTCPALNSETQKEYMKQVMIVYTSTTSAGISITSQLIERNTVEEAEAVCKAIRVQDSTYNPNNRSVVAIKLY